MGRRGLPVSLALLAVCAGLVLLGPTGGRASWSQVEVKVVTIHYKTHDGYRRAAYVVVPDWYGPGNNPPLPLIISPHGRGVSAEENVDRWGNLPKLGPFAVVNPEGQGRRFRRLSWGYPGQIDDLARMPEIVRRAIPWLRLAPKRIYAFGTSMGGQETLLLAARHPGLLAGAAAFDPVTTWPGATAISRAFAAIAAASGNGETRSASVCATSREPRSAALRRSAPRAYARRSPITYARALARSGVPLQLWWSRTDRVVRSADQAASLARKLRRLSPAGPLQTVVGTWPHSADMRPYFMLIPSLKKFDLVPTREPASLRAARSGPAPQAAAVAPRRAGRTGKAAALVSTAGRAWLRPRAAPRLEVHRTARSTRSTHRREGLSQLRGLRWPDPSRRVLATQPRIPQCDVRRLARVVVPLLG